MAKNQEILLMDKNFMVSVVDTLKTLDVRGYESNYKLVSIVSELQKAILTNLPLDLVPNQEPTNKEVKGSTSEQKQSQK